MEYGDIFVSDDGTRAVRWVLVDEHAKGVEYICAKCALHGSNCMLDDIDGWSTMAEAIRKNMKAQREGNPAYGREWNPVCGDGIFVELDPLERELVNVGGV